MGEQQFKNKKFIITTIVSIVITIAIMVGVTFAFLTAIDNSSTVKIAATPLKLVFDDASSNAITLTANAPVDNTTGMSTNYYGFTLTNDSDFSVNYNLTLVDDNAAINNGETRIDNQYVTYGLTKNDVNQTPATLASVNNIVDSGTISSGATINFKLRLWINSAMSAEDLIAASNCVLASNLYVTGTQLSE